MRVRLPDHRTADPRLMGALDLLEASIARTETVLVGTMADRAALHRYIARIEALGLELVELQRFPRRSAADGVTGCCSECGRDMGAAGSDVRAITAIPQT